jgi:hypothetical protein
MTSKKKHGKKRTSRQVNLNAGHHQYPFWLLEGIAGCLLIVGSMLTPSPFHKKVALIVFFAAFVLAGLGVVIKLWNEFSEPAPNKLDQSSSSPLTESKTPSASPIVSPASESSPPIATLPSTIPSPIKPPSTPSEHRGASLSLQEVSGKLSNAINSTDSGKYDQVRNALKGLRVDWTLNFYSANRDSSGKSMQVWLYDPEQIIGLGGSHGVTSKYFDIVGWACESLLNGAPASTGV